jgi:N-acetylneuraminic acid mutarotase
VIGLFALTLAAPPALPPLPEAVSSLGACFLDGHLYVYGGHAGRTHSYATETTSGRFRRLNVNDPAKGWEDLPGGPHLQGLALVAHAGRVYRVGGMRPRNMPGEAADNHSVASVARFDPAANRWERLADLPEPRSSHDAVVVGDTLVVVGGWRMNGREAKPDWHDTALTLDLADPKADWRAVPQPFRRRALTAAAVGGKVYVIAGLTPDANTAHAVDIFDPAAGTWAAGPAVPGDRLNGFTPAAAASDGAVYLNPADGVVYRLAGDRWEPVSAVPTPRFVHRLVPVGGGRLAAVGGASKSGNVAAVEVVGGK